MSERDIVDAQDDGEPPSTGRRHIFRDFLVADNESKQNYQTGEVYDVRFSEYMAVQSLTADVERILAEYGGVVIADSHDDLRVQLHNVTLTRRTLVHFDRDDDADVSITTHSYFYVELQPDGDRYCRSWTNDGERINWCARDKEFEPASDVRERVVSSFPEKATLTVSKKRHLGFHFLRRAMSVSRAGLPV